MAGALQSLVAVFSLPGSLLRRCGRYVALFTCILVASHIPPAQAQAGVERVKSLWETRRAYVKTGRFRYWLLDDSTPHALKTEQLDSIARSAITTAKGELAFRRVVEHVSKKNSHVLYDVLRGPREFAFSGSGRSRNIHSGFREWNTLDGPILGLPPIVIKNSGTLRHEYHVGAPIGAPLKRFDIDDFIFIPDVNKFRRISILTANDNIHKLQLTTKEGVVAYADVDWETGDVLKWWLTHEDGTIRRERVQFLFEPTGDTRVPTHSYDAQYATDGHLLWVRYYYIEKCELNIDVEKDVGIPIAEPNDVIVDHRRSNQSVQRVARRGVVTSAEILGPPYPRQPMTPKENSYHYYSIVTTAIVVLVLAIAVIIKRFRAPAQSTRTERPSSF